MSGKGSSPRPFSVDRKTYEDNWEQIFRKNKEQPVNEQKKDEQKKSEEKSK